jgi:hypothetical protein
MYARVAFFEDHDPAEMDELVRRLEERSRQHPDVLPDARSFLVFVDRERGRSVGITFFDTVEALEAAEPAFSGFPRDYPDSLKGRRVALDVYEVAVVDRPEAIAGS